LEVLVAFTICALMLGAFLQIFSTGLRTGRVTDSYGTAVLHAQSLLAAVGKSAPISAGETAGQIDARYRWRLNVQRYEDGRDRFEDGPLSPYQVTISVLWMERDEERSVQLATLRFAKPG
jgi:hypothetical protein